ncbi:MAG: hypothetical protein JSU92_03340 [Deltaproteobacteria bacterium]|nr:MAG: hypothetical protein JSU92_03340 [Deltaproteobacteria bacterium]
MKVRFLTSFDRSLRALEPQTQKKIKEAVDSLLLYFETTQHPKGLGLKKLRSPYWEIRVGLKNRVVFSFENDLLTFILAGDHDSIKRFLHHLK